MTAIIAIESDRLQALLYFIIFSDFFLEYRCTRAYPNFRGAGGDSRTEFRVGLVGPPMVGFNYGLKKGRGHTAKKG